MFRTIKQKSIVAGIAIFMLTSMVAGAGLFAVADLNAGLKQTEQSARLVRSHMEADMMHDAIRGDAFAALLAANPALGIDPAAVKQDMIDHGRQFSEAISNSQTLANGSLRPALNELKQPLADYQKVGMDIVDLARSNPQAAAAMLPEFQAKFERLETLMAEASDKIEADSTQKVKDADRKAGIGQMIMGVALLVGAAVSLIIVLLMNRLVVTPVARLTNTMSNLANGEAVQEVPGLKRTDEIGEMSRATETFRIMGEEKARLEAEAEAARIGADAHRAEVERLSRAKSEDLVVQALAQSLGRMAQGDLTCEITSEFPPQYEQIKMDFNAALEGLAESMQLISSATGAIQGGSEEIAHATDDLCKRTEQQAASLEETAAALDEITATVKRSAEGAKQAAAAASGATLDAEQSGTIVSDAVQAMGEIRNGSNQISQIIGVIDEIAFQTNLLALNAGVEAARAGDAGRGFAVVAQEVRALAQRSADAAKEIKALISSSSAQVERGVKLVDDTGQALVGIAGKVTEIDTLIREISQSSQEQATALAQVNTAINQMDQITQQNAAMVEEATAAASNLQGETRDLAKTVGRFRIVKGDSSHSAPQLANPRRHAPAPNPVAQAQARIKTFANGAPASSASADGWEEF